MYYGEKRVENPIRWGMVGGGRGSQIGYIHRSAALRDFNFELVAGAFDIDPERGKDFGKQLHVDPDRCYPDYKTMFAEEAKRPDGVQAAVDALNGKKLDEFIATDATVVTADNAAERRAEVEKRLGTS